jgi:exodeoxyribonuclease V gamma subunit
VGLSQQGAQLPAGLAIVHGNRLESLRELLVHWMRAHPLGVLENETILVQSNGIAQWLQLALAHPADDPQQPGCGIAAALRFNLPAAFLWQAYRAVLGEEQVPAASLYDKSRLSWRLLRLLPEVVDQPECAQLRHFLAEDPGERKAYQLAERLADLYDQYQVYRADWLADWAAGHDRLRDARGELQPLPPAQRWQPLLWRAIRADLEAPQRASSRADLHRQFLAACTALGQRPAALPRRLIVFGISALPQQFIEALAALAQHTQILLFVHNPCRHYWADIIEGKELLRTSRQHHERKASMPAQLSDADLHLHAHPLLAAWGRQGRDYIRLLDAFDDPQRYAEWFQRIDLFDEPAAEPHRLPLLQQLQRDILELEPAPAKKRPWRADDASVVFHIAHSRQREVEILHDQLLEWFRQDPGLRPRDVIVMMPDINGYAPHIRAVFGRVAPEDPRFIPFTLSDQQARGRAPLLVALEMLLCLPQERFGLGQLFDLLEVPAVRARFALSEADLPQLQAWVREAGIRWGLDEAQRAGLELPPGMEQNTWLFGLRRMLLGYLMGEAQHFAGIEAYGEVGGLDAARVGPLAELLEAMLQLYGQLQVPRPFSDWLPLLEGLLERFLLPVSEQDLALLDRLGTRLQQLQEACTEAALQRPLPVEVVREAWLEGIDEHNLSQRFLGGAVNMATLMPMRAIPFRRVCLLGMNDGDYPRVQPPMDFDLMAGRYRPGDRSRREDDRYLFLEALLSAREALYISWIGRSVRDNSEQPPSVLVAQLRDHLQQGWYAAQGDELLTQLSTEHPLHPFSRRYFANDPRLFTYAAEWRAVHEGEASQPAPALPPAECPEVLDLAGLQRFLRHPVRLFFNRRLGVWFEGMEVAQPEHEPFGFDRLEQSRLGNELIAAALRESDQESAVEDCVARWQRAGTLPLGPFREQALGYIVGPADATLGRLRALHQRWQPLAEPLELQLKLGSGEHRVLAQDWVRGVYARCSGRQQSLALILHSPLDVSVAGKPHWRRLLNGWVTHLALCACGHSLNTLLAGPDALAAIRPLQPVAAQQQLDTLLSHYLQALSAPAPLAPRTAFALLAAGENKDPVAAAREMFDGTVYRAGERDEDRYLQRAWPDFDTLLAAGFADWAQALYRPLMAQAVLLDEAEA